MQIAIAIPTYNRSAELKVFIDRHYSKLRQRQINIYVFHNEPKPSYSPQHLAGVRCFNSSANKGIIANSQKIVEHFIDNDTYYIYTSDQEQIVWSEFDHFCSLLLSIQPDIASFCRVDSDDARSPTIQTYDNYAQWLSNVAFSETVFAYRGSESHSRNLRGIGLDLFKLVPTHSIALQKSAVSNVFLGLKTSCTVFKADPLGSIASGWTSWIPNTIICHLVFIKYAVYACSVTAVTDKSHFVDARIINCIRPFLPGLCNHLHLSVNNNMYAGIRVANLVASILRKYSIAFTAHQSSQAEYFISFNSHPLGSLNSCWINQYRRYDAIRSLFASMYPSWII